MLAECGYDQLENLAMCFPNLESGTMRKFFLAPNIEK